MHVLATFWACPYAENIGLDEGCVEDEECRHVRIQLA